MNGIFEIRSDKSFGQRVLTFNRVELRRISRWLQRTMGLTALALRGMPAAIVSGRSFTQITNRNGPLETPLTASAIWDRPPFTFT